jgi:fluoroacetyl-CoA thioesterase
MCPTFQPGLRFEWRYTIPARATVPQLYHDTPVFLDMPYTPIASCLVGMVELTCLHGMMPPIDGSHAQRLGTLVDTLAGATARGVA